MLVATTRQSLSAAMGDLLREGVVTRRGRELVLTNAPRPRDLAGMA
jgi:hypothetical protein